MTLIGGSWNPATISALAAIFGSLSGALASSVSTWMTQRHQDRRDLLAKRIFHCEQLYSDFISESTRAMADAIQHTFQGHTVPSSPSVPPIQRRAECGARSMPQN